LSMQSRSSKLLTELLKSALAQAREAGVESHQVRLLLSEITDIPIPALTLNSDQVLAVEQQNRFRSGFIRLLSHEPVQYIIGKTEFYGLQLDVNENVLIPRPETEGLVEWISAREKGFLKVLDIGTGSGVIALALKKLKPQFDVTATDISVWSIRLARQNAQKNSLKVTFQKADLFPQNNIRYDVIVSNPPYVSAPEYALLADGIRYYEPRLALQAAKHGLEFYERILSRASKFLVPQGRIYFEIGESQAPAIREIAFSKGFRQIELKQDLAGRDRYLCLAR